MDVLSGVVPNDQLSDFRPVHWLGTVRSLHPGALHWDDGAFHGLQGRFFNRKKSLCKLGVRCLGLLRSRCHLADLA